MKKFAASEEKSRRRKNLKNTKTFNIYEGGSPMFPGMGEEFPRTLLGAIGFWRLRYCYI
jgi:hypothetical protein